MIRHIAKIPFILIFILAAIFIGLPLWLFLGAVRILAYAWGLLEATAYYAFSKNDWTYEFGLYCAKIDIPYPKKWYDPYR